MTTLDSWNKTPFIHHFINFKSEAMNNTIPFAIGGATQQGVSHQLENQNNQDAISIELNDNFIIGVVCDGCTGTHNRLKNSFSNNDVAAKLFATKIINEIKNEINEIGIIDTVQFLKNVSDKLISDFSNIVEIMCPDSEEEKEIFIFDFLMTTILGFVVTNNKFVVFNYGDGIFGINGKVEEIQESGKYFSQNLLKVCCPNKFSEIEVSREFSIYQEGNISELENIFLASDGFLPLLFDYSNVLIDFVNRKNVKLKNGFDFLLQDLRRNLITQEKVNNHSLNWLKDDASFLLLSRIGNSKETEITKIK